MTTFHYSNLFYKFSNYVNTNLFGKNKLLATNALLSTLMGTLGDAIQQNYEILSKSLEKKDKPIDNKFNYVRSFHMSSAGLTTGVLTHYWYIILDRYLGKKKCIKLVLKKVLIDQIIFSPINLACYFTTVGLLERNNFNNIKKEIQHKGLENIYLVEWAIWPPAQFINFYLLPLRYRILWDNIVSLGFDIYSPYVKYKTELKEDVKSQLSSH